MRGNFSRRSFFPLTSRLAVQRPGVLPDHLSDHVHRDAASDPWQDRASTPARQCRRRSLMAAILEDSIVMPVVPGGSGRREVRPYSRRNAAR